ncbi:DUF3090 domain-containing protein [Nocardioides marmoribigeumensis]|uniref:Repeat protein (TIGR03847 family) n=1 Tax=Nocardioides marmoribigeumensis TaxID=433649 RepID=A0ABU2C1B8_9ACTN|nr:DUF3090 domain-containing protein [Nocardioides marmoribigeumensis]MDR7364415.1 putative repeat protein (TIGR03847 family) [Nocardioides marmoribigeumensis]
MEHRFDPPDRFVAGTVGEPGQRTFFIQARAQGRLVSIALEKQQVQLLAERIEAMLDDLLQTLTGASDEQIVPALTPEDSVDREPLDTPIEEEFRAGTMTLAWDDDAQRVIVEVFAIEEDVAGPEDLVDPETEREVVVVVLPPTAARAFCERAKVVVSAGRPSCDFCGNPLDPDGHLCPRMNGFRRR